MGARDNSIFRARGISDFSARFDGAKHERARWRERNLIACDSSSKVIARAQALRLSRALGFYSIKTAQKCYRSLSGFTSLTPTSKILDFTDPGK